MEEVQGEGVRLKTISPCTIYTSSVISMHG